MAAFRIQRSFQSGVLCLAFAACGGKSGVDPGGTASGGAGGASSAGTGGSGLGGGGTGGTGTGGTAGEIVGYEGSYDLEFHNVVAQRDRPGSVMPTSPSPSEGANARVDIRRLGSFYDALVSPRWGTPVVYHVTIGDGTLILTGSAIVQNQGLVSDKWTEIRLRAHTTFDLTGGATASGEETIISGDVVDTARLTSEGVLLKDRTNPEVRFELASPILPARKALPWETFAVRMAEGVDVYTLPYALFITWSGPASSAPMQEPEWTFEPSDITAWGGVIRAKGRMKSWDALNGRGMNVNVAGPAVIDPSGLSIFGMMGDSLMFLDVNLAVPGYPLDAPPTPVPAQWGDVAIHGMAAPDPICESGACAVLGPFQNNYCSVGRSGVAGRLNPPAGRAAVRVRYRILAAPALGTPPTFSPPPLSIDVAAPGVDPQTTEVALPKLTDLGDGAGEFRYASEFLDAVAPGPDVDAPELGFAIYAGTRSAIACGPGGLLPPPVKMQVVVDKITVEPR